MRASCNACPRACGVDRQRRRGYCGMPAELRIARADLHPWEEPSISGANGSGTVFFCGCNLRCVYCQNRRISNGEQAGVAVSPEELERLFLRLRDRGAANINLVTPTHYTDQLIPILQKARPKLGIPVVYNCGGYDSAESLKGLQGLIDVYLPDCKYFSSELSLAYSAAPDYFPVAMAALEEMLSQVGAPVFDENGLLRRGVILRHLVLPGCREDSKALLNALCQRFGNRAFLLSLMSQYTPAFAPADAPKNLRRRVTSFEYEDVLNTACSLGFEGYLQARSSAVSHYTPAFDENDLRKLLDPL
ncbi:MAG: radical SAM protein [Ruminococcaceae bacterium]|nr:radical SAM protein [Oscillospiraceae bacterium]